MDTHPARYGVLGVGALASAIVTGLCDGVAEPPMIVLSPRNAEASAGLAARFDSVSVAADNQAVLDAAELVFVTLRRAHADVLGELIWRPEHVVVSGTGGLPLGRLRELVAPADRVARAVPMPAVASRSSRTPVHPPLAPVVEVFERLGGAMPIDDGDEFEAIFTAMGTVAPFFEYLRILLTSSWATASRPPTRNRSWPRPTPGCWSRCRRTRVRTSLRWSRSTRRPAAATPSSPP